MSEGGREGGRDKEGGKERASDGRTGGREYIPCEEEGGSPPSAVGLLPSALTSGNPCPPSFPCRAPKAYNAALQMSLDILQMYMQQHEHLAAAAAAADKVVVQTTKDTVMLLAEDAISSVSDSSVRPGRRLETLVERLTRCPALLDQVCLRFER